MPRTGGEARFPGCASPHHRGRGDPQRQRARARSISTSMIVEDDLIAAERPEFRNTFHRLRSWPARSARAARRSPPQHHARRIRASADHRRPTRPEVLNGQSLPAGYEGYAPDRICDISTTGSRSTSMSTAVRSAGGAPIRDADHRRLRSGSRRGRHGDRSGARSERGRLVITTARTCIDLGREIRRWRRSRSRSTTQRRGEGCLRAPERQLPAQAGAGVVAGSRRGSRRWDTWLTRRLRGDQPGGGDGASGADQHYQRRCRSPTSPNCTGASIRARVT